MSKSKIEWTDKTLNVNSGCAKISQGCKNCYAEREFPRLSANPKTAYFGRKFNDVMCHPEQFKKPYKWKKPCKIFLNSMSDLFHDDIPDEHIDRVFEMIQACPQHIFQILTKRPERMRDYSISNPFPKNVWAGVSIENQETAEERIPLLLDADVKVRWVSIEPLLGKIDLTSLHYKEGYGCSPCEGCEADVYINALSGYSYCKGDCDHPVWSGLDWAVVGGETGKNARPMHPDWVRSIRDQCKEANVPFMFKQWGTYAPISTTDNKQILPFGTYNTETLFGFKKCSKKIAGRLLDGKLHDEYPKVSL